jgi:4-diphosphocytidyl-2-C-methyl-D-erythritol kinase
LGCTAEAVPFFKPIFETQFHSQPGAESRVARAGRRSYNLSFMTVTLRSFAKINLGLYIGALRPDGFHDLRTVYQTISWNDTIRVSSGRGTGIEILCDDPRVPRDKSNTCYRIAERILAELDSKAKITIQIEKRLPVQGGLGAASSNAVATMLAMEEALKKRIPASVRLRIAAEVGSDLPLFLVGGTIVGVGRGEEVYPQTDLPAVPIVVVTPDIGVSTPKAFADWDARNSDQLTPSAASDRLLEAGCVLSSWLSGSTDTGAPAKAGSRAGSLILDLVRAGIENDFEKVVFPWYPELRDVKRALERAGAMYASLSGSGSALYGLFRTQDAAAKAANRLRKQGLRAQATATLARAQYWKKLLAAGL